MKLFVFSSRTMKEIIRDPLSLFFGLVFPIFLLILLTLMNHNIPGDIFDINELTPGIAVFGLSFMALLQTVFCFIMALFLGMEFKWTVIFAIISTLPIGIVFISTGLLLGSILSEKAVGGILGALMTNVTALFSGAWFSVELVGGIFEKIAYVLPFYHAVEMSRAAMDGQYSEMLPHIWWVLSYGIVISIGAVYVFRKKMKL